MGPGCTSDGGWPSLAPLPLDEEGSRLLEDDVATGSPQVVFALGPSRHPSTPLAPSHREELMLPSPPKLMDAGECRIA